MCTVDWQDIIRLRRKDIQLNAKKNSFVLVKADVKANRHFRHLILFTCLVKVLQWKVRKLFRRLPLKKDGRHILQWKGFTRPADGRLSSNEKRENLFIHPTSKKDGRHILQWNPCIFYPSFIFLPDEFSAENFACFPIS